MKKNIMALAFAFSCVTNIYAMDAAYVPLDIEVLVNKATRVSDSMTDNDWSTLVTFITENPNASYGKTCGLACAAFTKGYYAIGDILLKNPSLKEEDKSFLMEVRNSFVIENN